jgi:hypothetical protein
LASRGYSSGLRLGVIFYLMVDPITAKAVIDQCLSSAFVAGIIGNLAASLLYDAGKGITADISNLVSAGLQDGKLPANHDLYKLAHRSLRQALLFAHAACAHEFGEKLPFFAAFMQAWKEKRLFDQPWSRVRDTPQHTWLDRFHAAIKSDTDFNEFDGTGTGLHEVEATSLTAKTLDATTESLLKTRLSAWVDRNVDSPAPRVPREAFFETSLDQGFPIDGDAKRRLTVYAAWCLFFREGLKDDRDERPFKAYVIAKLEELSAASVAGIDKDDIDALAEEVSNQLIDKLGERIPGVKYFDDQFKKLTAVVQEEGTQIRKAVVEQADRVIDAVNQQKNTSLTPRLPALQNDFIGRVEVRDELIARFRSGDKVAGITSASKVGLHGQGGIGKTALALFVGHELAADFPDGQVYIDLRGTTEPLSPRAAMEQILRQFDPQAVFKDASDAQLADHYRNSRVRVSCSCSTTRAAPSK